MELSSLKSGFDYVGQRAVAEMIAYACEMFAVVLDRAFSEAGVTPPEVSLAADTVNAVLSIPRARWRKKMLNADERRLVEAMYDELQATGKVDKTLSADEARIRDLFAREVIAKRAQPAPENVFPFRPRREGDPIAQTMPPKRTQPPRTEGIVVPMEPPRPAPRRIGEPVARIRVDILKQLQEEAIAIAAAEQANAASSTPGVEAQSSAGAPATSVPTIEPAASVRSEVTAPEMMPAAVSPVVAERPAAPVLFLDQSPKPRGDQAGASARLHLAVEDAIVDAPSIGPKTATRFNEVGIDTVGEFLHAHPIALAARLELAHVTAETVTDWQDQTRLVTVVPGLRGTHAQLLVGAGYRTDDALRAADPDKLCADVLCFAASTTGQRLLRDGSPPDVEKIKGWLANAHAVKAA